MGKAPALSPEITARNNRILFTRRVCFPLSPFTNLVSCFLIAEKAMNVSYSTEETPQPRFDHLSLLRPSWPLDVSVIPGL